MTEEPSLKSLLRPRFRGTFLGGAIGDALGFPFEGSSPPYMMALGDAVTSRFERHRSGYFPAGQYSDDTQLTLATAAAITQAGEFSGEALAAAFIPLWRENRIVGRGVATTQAIEQLMSGAADWQSSGVEEGRAGNGAAMRAAPLGLWDYDDPEQLVEHVTLASRITHTDSRAVAGAVAVAAAVAYNVTHRDVILGEFIDHLCGAVTPIDEGLARHLRELPRLLSVRQEQALDEISTLGLEGPYRESGEGITPFVVPSVMVSFYFFLRSPNDYVETVRGCLLAGGDVDTTAAIAGSVSGALNGEAALPSNLLDSLLDRDAIGAAADSLYDLKERKRPRTRRR